ncbi:MAG TPA: GtrA family protein [Rhodoblastus sp.]|nr:GtrA family protein [Rhodoblastus sp.]
MSLDATTGALPAARLSRIPLAGFVRDAVGYGAASAVALVVDYGSLVVLNSVFHVGYLTAAFTAFMCGLVVAYLLNTRLVFRGRSRYSARGELVGFLLTGLAGLALNQALMFGFVSELGMPVAAAKAPTVGFVFLFNFLSRRLLLFTSA